MVKKDDPNRIRKIFGSKHLNESNKDFNKFLVGKTPATQKRYRSYRRLVFKRRADGLNFREEKKHIVFRKTPVKGKDIPSFKEIPETDLPVIYSQIYEFICETSYDDNLHHRHGYDSKTKKPNDKKAFTSHQNVYPAHIVLEFKYEGTWVRY